MSRHWLSGKAPDRPRSSSPPYRDSFNRLPCTLAEKKMNADFSYTCGAGIRLTKRAVYDIMLMSVLFTPNRFLRYGTR